MEWCPRKQLWLLFVLTAQHSVREVTKLGGWDACAGWHGSNGATFRPVGAAMLLLLHVHSWGSVLVAALHV
jgi:hypothetical protein